MLPASAGTWRGRCSSWPAQKWNPSSTSAGTSRPIRSSRSSDAGLDVAEPRRTSPSSMPSSRLRVPLDRELVVRDLGERSGPSSRRIAALVWRLDRRLILDGDEGADRRERRRQRHLEAAAARDDAVALQYRERAVRGDRPRRRSPSVLERDVVDASRLAASRSRGSARYASRRRRRRPRTAGASSSTGYCHTIQSARGPVSPSGIRRSRSPSSPRDAAEHVLGARERTLPTRCAPRGTKPAPVDVG